ncbi:adenylate cyclase [Rhodoblastus sphagnicola]|nr:adenylate/guanylate cyclase domain-containing protein [Rhodoblastus sphagnicola]MBB4197875.1 adenylate cyclase [Rhodoblastus sphagnicola]
MSLERGRSRGGSCWLYRGAFALNLGLFIACALGAPRALDDVRNLVFDRFQQLDPAPFNPTGPVRVAAIDEASLAALGQWPWPRLRLAELTEKLRGMGASAIGFDVVFAEADRLNPQALLASLPPELRTAELAEKFSRAPSNDARFAAALATAPSVLGLSFLNTPGGALPAPKAGVAMAGDDPALFIPAFAGVAAPLPQLAQAASGLGAVNWLPDRDQIVRRVPLLARLGDRYTPSLALDALRVALGATTLLVRASNVSGQMDFGAKTGVSGLRVGDLSIATDAHGAVRPHFSPPDPRRMLSIASLLNDQVPASEIQGRIVLIGPTASGLGDVRATPIEPAMAGVEIHAEIIEQILANALLTRPDWAQGAELAAALVMICLMAALLPRVSPLAAGAIAIVAAAALFAGALLAFDKAGLLLDPVVPALALSLQTLTGILALWRGEQAAKAYVQTAFGKFLSPLVVARLAENPDRLALGGETREVTVMFADLRNFTSLSEGLDAQHLTRLLNAYLTPMTDAILAREGTIDKYIGDAIMAFWNAPVDVPRHARRAVEAAMLMRAELERLNTSLEAQARADGRAHNPLRMGIGLNFGPCSVGNMGSLRRFDYSVLGDTVNLASRLEGASKHYGVDLIASEAVAVAAPEAAWLDLDVVKVKGRNAPVRIFTAAGGAEFAATSEFANWRAAHDAMLASYRAGDCEQAAAQARALAQQVPAPWRALYDFLHAQFTAAAPSQQPAVLLTLDSK